MREDYKRKLEYLQDPKMSLEIFDSLIGNFIGSGCSRDVYEYIPDNKFVVKIEHATGEGDNLAEYNIWRAIQFTANSKWFAPCQWISPNGMILIQRKTLPLYGATKNKVPEKIPSFFTDVHSKNFGWMDKQLVAHDYSFTLGLSVSDAVVKNKMQNTKNKL